jgi:hypothetical protein
MSADKEGSLTFKAHSLQYNKWANRPNTALGADLQGCRKASTALKDTCQHQHSCAPKNENFVAETSLSCRSNPRNIYLIDNKRLSYHLFIHNSKTKVFCVTCISCIISKLNISCGKISVSEMGG